jgi:putative membrane protein
MRLLLNWILSGLAVWLVAQVVPGFHVNGAIAALVAALVIGFINATIGALLKIITFPLTVLTLGLFWLVINALMLELASVLLSPNFRVSGFFAAFVGAIVLSLVNMVLKALVSPKETR